MDNQNNEERAPRSVGPIIGLIVILVIILVGGIYFWKENRGKNANGENMTDSKTEAEAAVILEGVPENSGDLGAIEKALNETLVNDEI